VTHLGREYAQKSVRKITQNAVTLGNTSPLSTAILLCQEPGLARQACGFIDAKNLDVYGSTEYKKVTLTAARRSQGMGSLTWAISIQIKLILHDMIVVRLRNLPVSDTDVHALESVGH
jgi:hypothetical protein